MIGLAAPASIIAASNAAAQSVSLTNHLTKMADPTMFCHHFQNIYSRTLFMVVLAVKHVNNQLDSTCFNYGNPQIVCVEAISPTTMRRWPNTQCFTNLLRTYAAQLCKLSSSLLSILTNDLTTPISIMTTRKFSAWNHSAQEPCMEEGSHHVLPFCSEDTQ
jgi:hypothetical protein